MAPIPLLPGMGSVQGITDLWWSPLLSDKWAPLVREYSFSARPLELITPGRGGPRHGRAGLAIFTISRNGLRSIPKMLDFKAPLLQVAAVPVVHVDMVVYFLPSSFWAASSLSLFSFPAGHAM